MSKTTAYISSGFCYVVNNFIEFILLMYRGVILKLKLISNSIKIKNKVYN